jgi:hypothetical protein
MAKSSRTTRSERQKLVEQMRAEQRRAERRRGLTVVAACVVVAVLIVGLAAYRPLKDWWDTRSYRDKNLTQIGSPASVCEKVTTKPATGNQQHIQDGSPVSYTDSPPAFGEHYITPDPMTRKFFTAQDRPALGTLVHNEEHGYTILWYDDSAAKSSSEMTQIRAIASKLAGTTSLRDKFKAVPWTAADGKPFPSGQHIAFTHWSIGGTAPTASGNSAQVGVWQYCSAVSGDALSTFMIDYPFSDSPEPNGP